MAKASPTTSTTAPAWLYSPSFSCLQTGESRYASGRLPRAGLLGGHARVVHGFLGRLRHWSPLRERSLPSAAEGAGVPLFREQGGEIFWVLKALNTIDTNQNASYTLEHDQNALQRSTTNKLG